MAWEKTMQKMKERNYGIDLLRLILMYMVCMLHALGQGGVLAGCEVGTNRYAAFWLLEIISYCAVDGFALISGYTSTDRPIKYAKIVNMWFQVFFYSFILTGILTIAGANKNWDSIDMLHCAFPVTFEKFWYFSAYFILFFLMPIYNRFIATLEEMSARNMLVLMFVLVTIVNLFVDPFKLMSGYSAFWLSLLYLIGGFAKKAKLFEKKKSITLVIMLIICDLVAWWLYVFEEKVFAVSYVSPFIVISAMILLVLFSRLKIQWKFISKISALAFGIYLFQLNQVIWFSALAGALTWIPEKRTIEGVIYAALISLLIFLVGLAVEFVRTLLAKLLRIQMLSDAIVRLFRLIIQKIGCLLN